MIAEANGTDAENPNGAMPGQLQGEVGVLDFGQDVANQAVGGGEIEGDESGDEADIEVRVVEGSSASSL